MTRGTIAAIIALGLAGVGISQGQATRPATSRPTTMGIVIGRDTTYVTGPLRPDGTVDYIAAVNAEFSQGVTPQNNAACLLVRINPPEDSRYEDTPLNKQMELMRLLGLQGNVPEQIPWHNLKEFDPKFASPGFIYPTSGYWAAMAGPWSAADMPALPRWLEANKASLDLAVEASHRERYWMSLVCNSDTEFLLTVRRTNGSRWRALADSLRVRAMQELQQGNRDATWSDLCAVHRIAGFLAHSPDNLDVAISARIQVNAWVSDRALLCNADISTDLLHRMASDMAAFARAPDIREVSGKVRRLEYLSAVEETARTWDNDMATLPPGQRQQMQNMLNVLGLWQPDWNRMLRLGNDYWDDVLLDDSAMPAEHQKAHRDEIEQRVRNLGAVAHSADPDWTGAPGSTWLIHKKNETRDTYSDRLGSYLLAITAPNVTLFRDTPDRLGNVELDWTEVAVNLLLYRREHGSYPAQLQDLVPQYMAHLPANVPDYPMRYERQADGCVLERAPATATAPLRAATRPTTNPDMNGDFFFRLP
jgi:hypothetical protein